MSDDTEERGRRADEIFERKIRPQVDVEEEARKYVAIDTESEDFEVHADQRTASDRLLERHPEAQGRIWFRRVGSPIAHSFGGRPLNEELDSSDRTDANEPEDPKDSDGNGRERISRNPDVLTGKPVIDGTRLSVEHILGLFENGWSEADILENYPHLDAEDVRACLGYARQAIDT
jgi:uncharacterized protein (DUF433 family)